jgi:hypothetical protein
MREAIANVESHGLAIIRDDSRYWWIASHSLAWRSFAMIRVIGDRQS